MVVGPAVQSQELNRGRKQEQAPLASVQRELEFTQVYREHENDHPYAREVHCLRQQVRSTLMPVEPGDWFAGRLDRALVGIDPERGDLTDCGYFCKFGVLGRQLERPDLPAGVRADIEKLLAFWRGRTTQTACRQAFSEHVRQWIPSDDYYRSLEVSYPMYGLGGPCLDFGRLLNLGIGGLRTQVQARRAHILGGPPEDVAFLEGCLAALDIFAEAARHYAAQARRLAAELEDPSLQRRCRMIATSCAYIAERPPGSYHQAVQLVWLYTLVALVRNYGRLDVHLGDLLVHDLDSGVLSDEEALDMTVGFWRLIAARGDNFNNRIIIGGRGRPNEPNADRFALLALDAQQRAGGTIPQLSLRWHEGMDPRIWDRALEVIAEGSTFPIIYNDDVNVSGVAAALDVPREDAEQYVMYGCGEYVIDHRSIGSPDAALNVAKVLDLTLRNGIVPGIGERRGLALGSLPDFETFDQLQRAFARQLEHQVNLLADVQDAIYRVTARQAGYPFLSMLYERCLERARPLLSGGVWYRGGTIETFGNTTAADSLTALKRLVYDRQAISPQHVLEALDADFVGYERERALLRAAPKFGNDDLEADGMSVWVNTVLCRICRRQRGYTGLHSFLAVLVNNGDHVTFGRGTGATPDGRKAGMPLSNGNQPTAGNDTDGLTAVLNSMAKLDPGLHAGAIQALKLSRGLIRGRPEVVSALLKGYFAQGGAHMMVTVTDRQELESAMANPEQYANLVVRVGGYSARFVELPADLRTDILNRTLY